MAKEYNSVEKVWVYHGQWSPSESPLALGPYHTCVSSRHGGKCVNLLKLRMELNTKIFKKYFKRLFTAINRKLLERLTKFQRWELGMSISYQLTYILIKLVLNCHTNRPYTSYVQDFFFKSTIFWSCAAVVSHCQPVKVVTALIL